MKNKITNKSYLYIAEHFDIHNNREIGINDKKIGITTNPKQREASLNATKSPIGVTFIRLWEFEGENTAFIIENSIFHNTLSDRNTIGEWFEDDDFSLVQTIEKAIDGFIKLKFSITEVLDKNTKFTKPEKIHLETSQIKYGKLKVMYNGTKFYDKIVKNTFLDVLSEVGLERCMNSLGEKVITTDSEISKEYRNPKKIDGYFIETNNSTTRKYQFLTKLKNDFNLNMEIESVL